MAAPYISKSSKVSIWNLFQIAFFSFLVNFRFIALIWEYFNSTVEIERICHYARVLVCDVDVDIRIGIQIAAACSYCGIWTRDTPAEGHLCGIKNDWRSNVVAIPLAAIKC